jgi:hypothetical protein
MAAKLARALLKQKHLATLAAKDILRAPGLVLLGGDRRKGTCAVPHRLSLISG